MLTRTAWFCFGSAGGKPNLDEDAVGDDDLVGGVDDAMAVKHMFQSFRHRTGSGRGIDVREERSGWAYCGGACAVDPRPLLHRFLAPDDVDLFVLVFTGHGQPGTGDWLVNEFAIRPMDVFRMWEANS